MTSPDSGTGYNALDDCPECGGDVSVVHDCVSGETWECDDCGEETIVTFEGWCG